MCPGSHRRRIRSSAEQDTHHHLEGSQVFEGRTSTQSYPAVGHLHLCQDRDATDKSPPCISERFTLCSLMSADVCFLERGGGHHWTGLGEQHKLSFMGLVSIFKDFTENTTNLKLTGKGGHHYRKTAYREEIGYTRGRSALGNKATPRQSQNWPKV